MECNLTKGRDDNKKDREDNPISPKLMRLSTEYTYTLKGLYPSIENVNKAARKKIP